MDLTRLHSPHDPRSLFSLTGMIESKGKQITLPPLLQRQQTPCESAQTVHSASIGNLDGSRVATQAGEQTRISSQLQCERLCKRSRHKACCGRYATLRNPIQWLRWRTPRLSIKPLWILRRTFYGFSSVSTGYPQL